MFKVIKHFVDLQDNKFEYNEGDIFPRPHKQVSDARLKELSSKNNKRGIALIEEVKEEVKEEKKTQKKVAPKRAAKAKKK